MQIKWQGKYNAGGLVSQKNLNELNLIELFKEFGFWDIVPLNETPGSDEALYGWSEYAEAVPNDVGFRFMHFEGAGDGFEEIEDADEYTEVEDDFYESGPRTIAELRQMFDYEELTDEEFLNLSASEFFGVTNAQFKFFNLDVLSRCDIANFIRNLRSDWLKEEIPDVQQRIRYATVKAALEDPIYTPHGATPEEKQKVNDHIMHLIVSNPEPETLTFLPLLSDYYRDYHCGLAINEERKAAGEPIIHYELCPKPSHIKDLHDKAARDRRTIDSRIEEEEKERYDDMIKQVVKTPVYKCLLQKADRYAVIAPKGYDDIVREGEILEHCVADYIEDFAEGRTLLYFLRKTEEIDDPYFTMEVKLVDNHYELLQCYTFRDQILKSEGTEMFIIEWARSHRIKIKCDLRDRNLK